jgi:hypothetical protein
MVRKIIVGTILGCSLGISGVATAFATGQPGASSGVACLSGNATIPPGNSMSAPGSVFNPTPGQSGTVYAGNPGTASVAHANSLNAVSQYDVACLQVTTH